MATFADHCLPARHAARWATIEIGRSTHPGILCITLDSAIAAVEWCWPHDIDGDCTIAYQEVHGALREEHDLTFAPADFIYDPEDDGWLLVYPEPWCIHVTGEKRLPSVVAALRRCDYTVMVVRQEAPVLGAR